MNCHTCDRAVPLCGCMQQTVQEQKKNISSGEDAFLEEQVAEALEEEQANVLA